MSLDTSYAARTGARREELPTTTADELQRQVAAAAAAADDVAARHPDERRGWLRALADALDAAADLLVRVADAETGLGEERLAGELARCAQQLRFYGDVAAEGSWLELTVDHRTETTPDLRRMQVPLGPVAVLGASNFPFAFGTLGHDTASALAAGCPVLGKIHPAHPETGRRLAEVAATALAAAGAPEGTLAAVSGFEAGVALVEAAPVAAVAFTGSQAGGMALWRAAQRRPVPIPVYAEMGTVNPVVVTGRGTDRLDEVAAGFVASYTLGMGQFCTKPGLLLVPAGHGAADRVVAALEAASPSGWLLTESIAEAYDRGRARLADAGARQVGRAAAPAGGWGAEPTVFAAAASDVRAGSPLLEECFGPTALVVEYDGRAELEGLLAGLPGALAASVQSGGPDDPEVPALVRDLGRRVGRVMVDDWPTGVALTWSQQHGGPWPATTQPTATSVGAAALGRFTRPVTWQSVPGPALPPPLREDSPWRLPRRVDGRLA
ncbi:aldehyde dehydrogenase family protein [Nocardioides sp.]|uniref:aldehyde dehydrogenase family protein n=1 Tax=Nocardioides sp. TaxID=35761 RepID=UPI003527B6AE